MALESARLGGLEVPSESFAAARRYLRASYDSELGGYRYSQDPERLASGFPTLPASTPAALFSLSLLGADLAAEEFADALDFALERASRRYRRPSDEAFVAEAAGNDCFWYYGTLALFRRGGPWERWNGRIQATLLPAQDRDGSRRPISPYAACARDDEGERSYTTAMAVLTLEIYYRYFTPLLRLD